MDSTSNILIDIDSNINNSNSSANCVDSSSSNTSSHGKKHKIESLEITVMPIALKFIKVSIFKFLIIFIIPKL